MVSTARRAISSASLATIVATVVIIIAIGTYATINIDKSSSVTSMTCSESTTTFIVIQNGTSQSLSYLIPAAPCQHQITLSGFTLNSSKTSLGSLTGNVNIKSDSPLKTFLVYVNGTYELFNVFGNSGSSSYAIQYNAVLNNATVPIFTGMSYEIEFVATFKDGTAATATTLINATA